MGSGLPAGVGGLTLRARLLAAAAGIVGVSLLLGGALTWFLVRDLELQGAQDQLDRAITNARPLIVHQQCAELPAAPNGPGPAGCVMADPATYQSRLEALAPTLEGERLLLLNRQRRIVFDSQGQGTLGQAIGISSSKRVANVGEARTTLDGDTYLAAATALAPGRDPLNAAYVVLAIPQSSVATAAASDLALRLMVAGGVALVGAMVLVLLVSRPLTGALGQLAEAAEDIAAGNYSRRVGIRGPDEVGSLGAAFDRMAEAVERARKVQRDFLANVSHELKTPLTSLIGFSHALIDGSLKTDEERQRAATVVHEEAERMLRMAQELLDLARVEAGTISMHLTAVDLGAQLEQELEVIRPRAAARALKFDVSMPGDMPPVTADPERLHQVIDNLLDNAVKYAPERSTVTVSARSTGVNVETVIANVAGDQRPDAEKMFERFYRADRRRSVSTSGAGLGLAISRELVTAMKGRLWADFDGANHLRMHLVLPAASGPDTTPAPAPQRVPLPAT